METIGWGVSESPLLQNDTILTNQNVLQTEHNTILTNQNVFQTEHNTILTNQNFCIPSIILFLHLFIYKY